MWDGTPFTLKRFGMELRDAGVHAYKGKGCVFYRVDDEWLKRADRTANPVVVEAEDPDNDWSILEEFVEGE